MQKVATTSHALLLDARIHKLKSMQAYLAPPYLAMGAVVNQKLEIRYLISPRTRQR